MYVHAYFLAAYLAWGRRVRAWPEAALPHASQVCHHRREASHKRVREVCLDIIVYTWIKEQFAYLKSGLQLNFDSESWFVGGKSWHLALHQSLARSTGPGQLWWATTRMSSSPTTRCFSPWIDKYFACPPTFPWLNEIETQGKCHRNWDYYIFIGAKRFL